MRTMLLAATALLAMGGASAAAAHTVYSPEVEKGELEVELKGGRLIGGEEEGEAFKKLEVGYGFTERLNLAVFVEVEDEVGEDPTAEAVGVEARIEIGRVDALALDVGAILEYEQLVHGGPGIVEGKLLLARDFGPIDSRLNLIVEQPITDRDGEGAMEFGYAARATGEVVDDFKLGVMALGDLGTNREFGGRQEHFVGPVADFELEHIGVPGELEIEVAYLFALGEADEETDGQLRFAIEWERKF